ncbi:MAG: response regulator [Hyphomonadaceae bacterium]
MNGEAAEDAEIRILVADGEAFQRKLIADAVRAAGRARIDYADSVANALLAMSTFKSDILVVDWDLSAREGLGLVRRIRAGEAGAKAKAMPIIMVGQCTASEVELARTTGIDEFVARPFSTVTMMKRVMEVRARRREFIETEGYVGPCRRRRIADTDYDGPRRRVFDHTDKAADAPELQIHKGLVRTYVERLSAQLESLGANDADAVREFLLTCGQLSALGSAMRDRLLGTATLSLFNYMKAAGAGLRHDVVEAHLAAILQLAELQNHQVELRQTVTNELGRMVAKKLGQASARSA